MRGAPHTERHTFSTTYLHLLTLLFFTFLLSKLVWARPTRSLHSKTTHEPLHCGWGVGWAYIASYLVVAVVILSSSDIYPQHPPRPSPAKQPVAASNNMFSCMLRYPSRTTPTHAGSREPLAVR